MHLDISITPKVHAVFYHVKQFCLSVNKGLALFSEQAVEAVHYDFSQTGEKHKVSSVNSNYAIKLLRAVCEYNSNHL